MEKTSYRDYLTWMLYLDEQWNTKTKEDYYFAQIATEIGNVLRTSKFLTLEDRFIRFESSIQKSIKKETEEEKQSRLKTTSEWAKGVWKARIQGSLPKDNRKD
jgi:hypothetical protein